MKLTFCGGAQSVTGANYLLETGKKKVLIDCGLTQGSKFAEQENYKPFPYDVRAIDAVFVTHAHIDHIGLLPKLCKEGFKGKIYSTPPTKDLALPLLEDSLKLLSEEAEREKKPLLYKESDLEQVFRLWETLSYRKPQEIFQGIKLVFRDAGHILGSAIIELWAKENSQEQKIVFSGDLGNPPTPLLCPTELIDKANYVLVESTYGSRIHEDKRRRKDLLEDAIEDTITNGGVLMIPTFALERTQELLYELNDLVEHHRIPKIPIFIDSPLAIHLTKIYKKYPDYFNQETRYLISSGDEIFRFKGLRFTETVEESKEINFIPPPKVIIAGAGMSNGGRILHHERRYLSDPKSLLLIIAWQAEGSLGRQLLEGARSVKIFGERIPVKAGVRAIGGYSAHPDQEGLLKWLSAFDKNLLKKVFIVQGELKEAKALSGLVQDRLGIETAIPNKGEIVNLT